MLKNLEHRYKIGISRETLRQHLKYMNDKRNPKDEDCFRLLQSLSTLREENLQHTVFAATKGNYCMQYTACILE